MMPSSSQQAQQEAVRLARLITQRAGEMALEMSQLASREACRLSADSCEALRARNEHRTDDLRELQDRLNQVHRNLQTLQAIPAEDGAVVIDAAVLNILLELCQPRTIAPPGQ